MAIYSHSMGTAQHSEAIYSHSVGTAQHARAQDSVSVICQTDPLVRQRLARWILLLQFFTFIYQVKLGSSGARGVLNNKLKIEGKEVLRLTFTHTASK